jgi:TrmH family RNA methyltransferase
LGVIAVPGADPWAPKVLRAAAGAHFRTTLETDPDLTVADLSERGFRVVATAGTGGAPPWSLPRTKTAWLIGEEAHGLPADVIASADQLVTIPMPGTVESLNAAAAAAILAYEAVRPDRSG